MLEARDLECIAKIMDEKLEPIKKDISELKEDVVELKTDVAELKEDVAVLKEDVAVLKEDVTELKEDVAELKGDVAVLKEDIFVLKRDMLNVNNEISELHKMDNMILDEVCRVQEITQKDHDQILAEIQGLKQHSADRKYDNDKVIPINRR